ncbi:MAG: VWA domain-containing protein [Candidatus Acidiferrales bacterium]
MRLTTFAAGILAAGLSCGPILGLTGFPPAEAAAQAVSNAQNPSNQPAQQGQPGNQEQQNQKGQQPLRVQVNLVNVFATVRDKHKGIVSNLKQEDFKILEDGQEQKVAYFSKDVDLPITLGLLIDTSGSMDRVLPAEQDAATRFLREVMRPKDLTMVINFDLDANLIADFTQDVSVLERAIRGTQMNSPPAGIGGTPGTIPNSGGGTVLYDAIYLACHDELATEAGRKAAIVLTDAVDEGSRLRVQDAIEAAQRADAVIHVLLISDPGVYGFGGFGNPGPSVARKMAEETGGRVIDVHNQKSIEKAFDEISEELRSQYVLGYYPTNSKRDGSFRKIQVEVNQPDTKVLARKGYYAPGPGRSRD